MTEMESSPVAEPRFIRASLAIFARLPYQARPDNIWDAIVDIYEDSDTLQGWNRESRTVAASAPLKYMEQSRARLADLAARILNLIAYVDEAMLSRPSPPLP